MKAWRLNDYEWYAADTLEQAIQCAMSDTGCSRGEVFDDDYGQPEDDSKLIWADGEMTKKITVGELLKTLTEPCYAFGTE